MIRNVKTSLYRLRPLILLAILVVGTLPRFSKASADTIKVGILHSLSGTMSISEVSVKDAEMLAIDEIKFCRVGVTTEIFATG